ncbi:MAG TPA: pyridoxamine 5'-phosphate oxidase family protein, partial [Thermomicrobiales bacterium]|nr:pyridoxamine 5'-phosphate oxidase family protein [Thermomicrobiales bacterium]
MTERAPVETINLDQYGNPPVSWSQARDRLADGETGRDVAFFLGTIGPDGRPRAARVGALWVDGDFYFVSGPATRKSRNLAANSSCTIAAQLEGIDLVFEGEATRVVDPPTLEKLA